MRPQQSATLNLETPAARRWHLGYLGTYSEDRQPKLEKLLFETARSMPTASFVVAGPQYPPAIQWPDNVERIEQPMPRTVRRSDA